MDRLRLQLSVHTFPYPLNWYSCYLPTTRTQNVPSVIVFFGFCDGSAAGVETTVAAGRKIFCVFLSNAIVFALGWVTTGSCATYSSADFCRITVRLPSPLE